MKSDRERISIIKNGIVSTSESKVVVDHESDLSPTKKPILFLSFLFLQADLLFEVGILDDFCSKQKQSSRPAVQNSGNPYLQLIAMI